MTQAHQQSHDGRSIVSRWYVWTRDGRRIVTWAETAIAARRKARARGLEVERTEPAPSRLDESPR